MDKGDIGLLLGRGIVCVKTSSLEDLSCKEWKSQPNEHVVNFLWKTRVLYYRFTGGKDSEEWWDGHIKDFSLYHKSISNQAYITCVTLNLTNCGSFINHAQ